MSKFSSFKEWQKLLIAFIACYAILFIMQALLSGIGLLSAWSNNPTFYLLPLPGFFFAYFAAEWAGKFFETKSARKPWFAAVFLIMALIAWHVAITFYVQNNVSLSLNQNQNYINGEAVSFSQNCTLNAAESGAKRNLLFDSFGAASCLAGEQFLPALKSSPYLTFVIAAIFGWIAFIFIKKNEE